MLNILHGGEQPAAQGVRLPGLRDGVLRCAIPRPFGVELAVLLDPAGILLWNLVLRKDRVRRTLGLAGTAVNAGIGVDPIGRSPLGIVFGPRDDTFHRTDLRTGAVPNAQLGDHIRHDDTSSFFLVDLELQFTINAFG
jgi:hypothetical protein